MKPQEFTSKLKDELGDDLKAGYLYGSSASADFDPKVSDYNVMLVVEERNMATLNKLAKVCKLWIRSGNATPLIFTEKRILNSLDVFPIEFFDIKRSYKVLFGEDFIKDLDIQKNNLRHQLENEFKGKLIHLSSAYLQTSGKPKAVAELMTATISSFVALFRGAIWLLTDAEDIPDKKVDVIKKATEILQIDSNSFAVALQLKNKEIKVSDVNVLSVFDEYITNVQIVADKIDSL
jgi:predicted nucleotidyltransferase